MFHQTSPTCYKLHQDCTIVYTNLQCISCSRMASTPMAATLPKLLWATNTTFSAMSQSLVTCCSCLASASDTCHAIAPSSGDKWLMYNTKPWFWKLVSIPCTVTVVYPSFPRKVQQSTVSEIRSIDLRECEALTLISLKRLNNNEETVPLQGIKFYSWKLCHWLILTLVSVFILLQSIIWKSHPSIIIAIQTPMCNTLENNYLSPIV